MPHYFDAAHRQQIETLRQRFTARTEWPTWLLLIGVYGGWFAIVLNSHWLGRALSTLLLIPLVVLWLSVQHELLHGHPTRWPLLNKTLGYAPFAVWYPYTLYRDSHLRHHRDEDLTLPGIDPESRYLSAEQWQGRSLFERGLHWLNKTVIGRFLLGAPLALLVLAREETVDETLARGIAASLVDALSLPVAIGDNAQPAASTDPDRQRQPDRLHQTPSLQLQHHNDATISLAGETVLRLLLMKSSSPRPCPEYT